MPNFISEDDIEQAVLQRLSGLGYTLLNCFTAQPEDLNDRSGRTSKRDVILFDRLKRAACRLNPHLPEGAVDAALARVVDRRTALSAVAANRELDRLIRDGVPAEFENAAGRTESGRVRLVDFDDAGTDGSRNEFLAVAQLWIQGEQRYRRPDVILYVNGLPLVFIELKNSNVKLKTAYDKNLVDYRADIPQLFTANAFCILSNAVETKVGSFTAAWEHFFKWLRVDAENESVDRDRVEREGTSVEYALQGLCAPRKLLDYVENFVLFYKASNKIIAQNHQFIGVNRAFEAFETRHERAGKLGVFWHTQGSGKSFSMIFYVRKIFRKLTGNFSFLMVTDRADLDGQIYRTFLNTGTVSEKEAAQPKNSAELRKFLGQNKRVVFTLIQKFRYDKGKAYPRLSDRDDIVVIVDEAHRTQYASLAENMRAGLPHAQYLAFTGTPLLGRDRKTSQWFGDYVSEYNFQQSMDDGATVPLFYQKRVPEVLIQNEDLSDEFYEILEAEALDEAQQEKLEKKYAQELEVIKRDDRLETIAKDIVYHFPRRGYLGKGMVVSLDKFTAVRMYDKVQRHWKKEIKALRGRIRAADVGAEQDRLKQRLAWMRMVQMAVVVSEEAGEEAKFAAEGLTIQPHRERMNSLDEHGHDIEANFKNEGHPLHLVFVCAMWLTGFDAPTVSTLYLDKPMKDHTLMQTIARANRVTAHLVQEVPKRNGEIVDYYNVFRNMKKALKDYAQGDTDLPPVREKSVLFDLLADAIDEGVTWCAAKGVDLNAIAAQDDVFKNVEAFKAYADILVSKDEWRKAFNVYDNTISALYEACKPDIMSRPPDKLVFVFSYLRSVMDSVVDGADIGAVSRKIAELLDESVVVDDTPGSTPGGGAVFQLVQVGKTWDLSKVDFAKLKEDFKDVPYKHLEIADLRAFLEDKLVKMLEQNQTRSDFAQRLQTIIDRYNAGASATENYFDDLMDFNRDLREEDERHIREGLSEDELELFDLLKKDKLTQAETQTVKLAAKTLLKRLVEEQPKVLIQDWYKDAQSRQRLRSAVEEVLDAGLPDSYDRLTFKQTCENVYGVVFDYSSRGVKWAA